MAGTALVLRAAPGPLDAVADRAMESLDACRFADVVAQTLPLLGWVGACGDTSTGRYLRYIGATALLHVGEVERAGAVVEALQAGLPEGEDALWRAKALALSAQVALATGGTARAVLHLAEAEDLLEGAGPGSYQHLSAVMATGMALHAAGAHGPAEQRLRWVLAGVRRLPGLRDLNVLPELTLLVVERAVVEELQGRAAAADAEWTRALSLVLRWRRAAQEAGEPEQVLRAAVCEALAWYRLDRRHVAAAVVGDGGLDAAGRADGASSALAGRVEAVALRLVLAEGARAAGDAAAARAHLDAGLVQARQTEAGTWTFALLAARAEVAAGNGSEGSVAAAAWRELQHSLMGRVARASRSLASEVDAHRAASRAAREAGAAGAALLADPLTGVANRRGLDEALALAAREGRRLSACFVDVDRFKAVNDDFSHEVGDLVLRRTADLLTAACREGDLVARYGGDEFVVVTGPAHDLSALAQRVLDAVAHEPWQEVAQGLAVSVSVGAAHGLEAAAVLAAADGAMFEAKRAGRARAVLR